MINEPTLHLTIANVSERLYEGDVYSVNVPGIDGEMTILPHHEALITLLKQGKISVLKTRSDETISFVIQTGFLETSSNRVTILV